MGRQLINVATIEYILLKSKSNESCLQIIGISFLVYIMSLSRFEIYKCHWLGVLNVVRSKNGGTM
jgi:hypothetical protein